MKSPICASKWYLQQPSCKKEINMITFKKAAVWYLWRNFTFFTKDWSFLGLQGISKQIKSKWEFSDNFGQNISRLFHFLAHSKISCKTVYRQIYFTEFCEFFSTLLSKIVWGIRFLFLAWSRSLDFKFFENFSISKVTFVLLIDI